jgi:hypothetical protein
VGDPDVDVVGQHEGVVVLIGERTVLGHPEINA